MPTELELARRELSALRRSLRAWGDRSLRDDLDAHPDAPAARKARARAERARRKIRAAKEKVEALEKSLDNERADD